MVIGTVKGDIHDIGKNLVSMMMEGAGFEVINLGVNNDADKFIAAIKEHNADIIGMSALLTTTMPYMKVIIQALKDEGLRDKMFVMVGGAPVSAGFAEEIEAMPMAAMPRRQWTLRSDIWHGRTDRRRDRVASFVLRWSLAQNKRCMTQDE